MGQIFHTRSSGASVSDEEAERVQHTPTLDDWLYIMSLWLQLKSVCGSIGYSFGILAPASLDEIRIK